ncbi:hypothetical protein [Kurthia senegalensis]|uniref:hypothetical protein n=1 Tax=Kurthia senegalensis TaxID=1033740 RepID=UPI000287DF07|nr:hypothetical protein [Kurthia senegalensis]
MKTFTLLNEIISIPSDIKAYTKIRLEARTRSKQLVQQLREIENSSLHLVAAFQKVQTARVTLTNAEIAHYFTRAASLHNRPSEADFYKDAEKILSPIEIFERQTHELFEEAKLRGDLAAINDVIFTAERFEHYYQLIEQKTIELHCLYVRLVIDSTDHWEMTRVPFQFYGDLKEEVRAFAAENDFDSIAKLVFKNPYDPEIVALSYVLLRGDCDVFDHFFEAIGIETYETLFQSVDHICAWLGHRDPLFFIQLFGQPLFQKLLEEDGFSSDLHLFEAVMTQLSLLTKQHFSVVEEQEQTLLLYKPRGIRALGVTKEILYGKGKWFKNLAIPYSELITYEASGGQLRLNKLIVSTPSFDREDEKLLVQLLTIMKEAEASRHRIQQPLS